MINVCIVLLDMFSEVLDVRVKRGTELSTDHHLAVCSLRTSKPWQSRRSLRSSAAYRIKVYGTFREKCSQVRCKEMPRTSEIQVGRWPVWFSSDSTTMDEIFTLQQSFEKFLEYTKDVLAYFVDEEKAYDRNP